MKPRDDAGLTLVEMMVATMLISVATALMVAGISSVGNVLRWTDDDNRGLADAKVVLDRVARDVRQARAVVCDGGLANLDDATSADPSCAAHLQVWIDYDSDYAEDPDEVITWRLAKSADGEHFDVLRFQGDDTEGRKQATSLIVQTLFVYDTADPEDASEVTMRMRYDALVGRGVEPKEASVSARLRNKVG